MTTSNPIYTIGHSTLEPHVFIEALATFGVEKLIDVRSYPGSRFVPWFNKESLAERLGEHQIEYAHFSILGGRRKSGAKKDLELVEGWKNAAFKNYASYTLTEDYEWGISLLLAEAIQKTVAIMCAESVPWRCHRLLISNTLTARGIEVWHIKSKTEAEKHELNKYGASLKIQDGKVVYPITEL